MKLCTICDRPIVGTWCKTCKQFVKTYNISDDIHLNRSHDLKNDAGCTYHTTPTASRPAGSSSAGRSDTSANSRPTTNTRTTQSTATRTTANTYTSNRTTGGSSSGQTPKRSPKKLVGIIIGVYVLMVIGFTIVPMVAPFIIDAIKESGQENKEKDKETEKDDSMKLGSTGSSSLAQMLLRNVEVADQMTDTEDGEEVTYYFYDPEDIEGLGVNCDWEHFSMKRSYFESWTENRLDITMEPVFEQSEEYNYLYETEDDSYAYFISYAEYYAEEEDLAISVDYDTSSGRIHSLILYTFNHDKYAEYFSDLAAELDTEYDWDSELLQLEMMYAVEDKEDYEAEEIYCSDTMRLCAFPYEGGIGLTINVVVE